MFLALIACSRQDKKPEGILSEQKMVDILIDLHIIEARINSVRIPKDTVKKFFPELEEKLFEKHGVSDSAYYRSYQYYLENVGKMEEIYSAVVDSLSVRERVSNAD